MKRSNYYLAKELIREYPYLVLDSHQHKHFKISIVLICEVNRDRLPLKEVQARLGKDMRLICNMCGPLSVRFGLVAMDYQHLDVTDAEAIDGGAAVKAKADFFLVEQIRPGGVYHSDAFPNELLSQFIEKALTLMLSCSEVLRNRPDSWLRYYSIRLESLTRDVELTDELIARMKASETDWKEYLHSMLKAAGLLKQLEAAPGHIENLEILVKTLDLHGHLSYMHETEMLDFGYRPSAKRLVIPPGKFRVAGDIVVPLERADTGEETNLSFVYAEGRERGFVVRKPFGELQAIVSGEEGREARERALYEIHDAELMRAHHEAMDNKAATGQYSNPKNEELIAELKKTSAEESERNITS